MSDECWSCMCDACADTLNACDQGCTGALECGSSSECLVNDANEITCEISCVAAECLSTPEAQAGAQALVTLDACLISSPKPSGFRICEDVCGIPYTGDVCERYPQGGAAGAGGTSGGGAGGTAAGGASGGAGGTADSGASGGGQGGSTTSDAGSGDAGPRDASTD
jgi:hypothetical protein